MEVRGRWRPPLPAWPSASAAATAITRGWRHAASQRCERFPTLLRRTTAAPLASRKRPASQRLHLSRSGAMRASSAVCSCSYAVGQPRAGTLPRLTTGAARQGSAALRGALARRQQQQQQQRGWATRGKGAARGLYGSGRRWRQRRRWAAAAAGGQRRACTSPFLFWHPPRGHAPSDMFIRGESNFVRILLAVQRKVFCDTWLPFCFARVAARRQAVCQAAATDTLELNEANVETVLDEASCSWYWVATLSTGCIGCCGWERPCPRREGMGHAGRWV